MFSIYLYIIVALIVLLVFFVVRQVRLRQTIARRRALRRDASPVHTKKQS